MYKLDFFKEGKKVVCEQCQKVGTVQFDGRVPNNWWVIIDSKQHAAVFCSVACIEHFLSKHQEGASVKAVEMVSVFGRVK